MATFVQFDSAEGVMNAYNARGIAVWSIFQGKELISAGDGAEELENFLGMLGSGKYPVIYTLKVYNSVNNPDDITNKTECNGSFKFQLETVGSSVGGAVMPRFAGNGTDIITAKIHGVISEKVGKYVEDLLSGKAAEEKKPSFKEIAMGYLENPEDLQMIMGTIGSVVAMFKGNPAPAMVAGAREPARFAGAVDAQQTDPEANRDELGRRLVIAVNRLEKCDPEIVLHLEQLANLAENNPAMYKMALGFLKQQ